MLTTEQMYEYARQTLLRRQGRYSLTELTVEVLRVETRDQAARKMVTVFLTDPWMGKNAATTTMRIRAIKLVRAITEYGLADSKNLVDETIPHDKPDNG